MCLPEQVTNASHQTQHQQQKKHHMVYLCHCACGSVQFEAEGDPLLCGYCDCKVCQQQKSTNMLPFAVFSKKNLLLIHGAAEIVASLRNTTRIQSRGNGSCCKTNDLRSPFRWECAQCGSSSSFHNGEDKEIGPIITFPLASWSVRPAAQRESSLHLFAENLGYQTRQHQPPSTTKKSCRGERKCPLVTKRRMEYTSIIQRALRRFVRADVLAQQNTIESYLVGVLSFDINTCQVERKRDGLAAVTFDNLTPQQNFTPN